MASRHGLLTYPALVPYEQSEKRHWALVDIAIVTVIALSTAAMRLPMLTQFLWRDEGSTYFDVSGNLAGLTRHVWQNELTPPLYFIVEHLWVRLFGTSETMMRVPSLVFAMLTVVVLYAFGIAAGSRLIAIFAAIMAAITPLTLQAGMDARAYGLAVLLCACTLLAFMRTYEERDDRKALRWAVALCCSSALLIATHFTGYIIVGSLIVAGAVIAAAERKQRRFLPLAGAMAGLLATTPLLIWFHHDETQVVWNGMMQEPLLRRIDDHLNAFTPFGAMQVQLDRMIEVGLAAWIIALLIRGRFTASDVRIAVTGFVVAVGIVASMMHNLTMGRHLAPYAPAAWLCLALLLERFVTWVFRAKDAPLLLRIVFGLAGAYVIIGGAVHYPRAYRTAVLPISGAGPAVASLREHVDQPVLLVAIPDYLGPSLAYYTRGDRSLFLRGVRTWDNPEFYSIDPLRWAQPGFAAGMAKQIDEFAARNHMQIALAIDWSATTYNGMNYHKAHDVAALEMRRHRVVFNRSFDGSLEPVDLVLLANR